MHVQARVENRPNSHGARVSTDGSEKQIAIPARALGGSSASGGEMLFLALATCYCNDVYREARLRGIEVEQVVVTVDGEFGAPGEPARGLSYRARVWARAGTDAIEALMAHVDTVAEIHNTLRQGVSVTLADVVAVPR